MSLFNDFQAKNEVVKTWGEIKPNPEGHYHSELLAMIDGYDQERGTLFLRVAFMLFRHKSFWASRLFPEGLGFKD